MAHSRWLDGFIPKSLFVGVARGPGIGRGRDSTRSRLPRELVLIGGF